MPERVDLDGLLLEDLRDEHRDALLDDLGRRAEVGPRGVRSALGAADVGRDALRREACGQRTTKRERQPTGRCFWAVRIGSTEPNRTVSRELAGSNYERLSSLDFRIPTVVKRMRTRTRLASKR